MKIWKVQNFNKNSIKSLNKVNAIGDAPSGSPGCPDFAFWIASALNVLIVLIHKFLISISFPHLNILFFNKLNELIISINTIFFNNITIDSATKTLELSNICDKSRFNIQPNNLLLWFNS